MNTATSLQRMVALMDRHNMSRASELSLQPVCMPIAALERAHHFNRVIVLTAVTLVLFFIQSIPQGIDAMRQGETS